MKIDEFLSQAGAFFLATVDGDQPKLRPLGAHHVVDGALWLGVGEFKNVYRQLAANPKCELVALRPNGGEWLRYTGRAVFAEGAEREKLEEVFLEAAPGLRKIYDKQPGHRMMCFRLADARAEVINLMPPGEVLFDETPATVYFTHDISPEGLQKAYKALGRPLEGRKVAVKISTGEAGNTHYLKPELIGPLVKSLNADIVECNTAYGGSRQETADHRKTIEDHGFNAIAKVVILDEFDQLEIPTPAGSTHFDKDLIGAAFTNYDGFVILNHFKGHMMGGFGGALKNLSIGVASTAGKARIHSAGKTDDASKVWNDLPPQKDFIESMGEAAGAVVNHMGDRVVYISVMNNLSIDCDCDAHPHKPEMADVGILASLDPVALDKACVDLVYASDPKTSASLRERMETRLGPHILDYAETLGYGKKAYRLVSLDEGQQPPSTERRD